MLVSLTPEKSPVKNLTNDLRQSNGKSSNAAVNTDASIPNRTAASNTAAKTVSNNADKKALSKTPDKRASTPYASNTAVSEVLETSTSELHTNNLLEDTPKVY